MKAAGTRPPSSAPGPCALGLALSLLALVVATPTGEAATGDDARLRPLGTTVPIGISMEFRLASNGIRLRVYLLSLAAMVKGEHYFVALAVAVPDLTTLPRLRHRRAVIEH
jgi:hypothetical protein